MSSGPVLFIGRADSPVLVHLREVESALLELGPSDPLTPAYLGLHRPRRVISHGYRIILPSDVLDLVPIVNLHISLLPWNRGADPVLWSVLEDTPSGVTIHHMDQGVDTGDIIAQQEVPLHEHDTFTSLYTRCTNELADLFRTTWPAIDDGTADRRPQPEGGTTHRVRHRAAVEALLIDGWDTLVSPLQGATKIDPSRSQT